MADSRSGSGWSTPVRSPCSVTVDARTLAVSGLGRYLREILAVLLADPRFGRVVLLGSPATLHGYLAGRDGAEKARVVEYPDAFYSPRVQLAWLRLRGSEEIRSDVFFFPHYDAPVVGLPRRSVVTVHDLIHFAVPDAFAWWRRRVAGVLFDRVVSRAARVLTVSESTRRDVVSRLPGVASRTEVIPNGVSGFFHPGPDAPPPGLEGLSPFLLCVGNRKPHKNLVAAVETLAVLRRGHGDLRLVSAGHSFSGWDEVLRRAEELGVREAVVEVDDPGDEVLRWLYRNCQLFLFPSLYEGFGLPVVEAMACGAPVVASNRSSVPDVVGDAGLLVDPEDPRAMAAAVHRVLADPLLRAELAARGRERAAGFDWGVAAADTVNVLYQVATAEVARAGARVEPVPGVAVRNAS